MVITDEVHSFFSDFTTKLFRHRIIASPTIHQNSDTFIVFSIRVKSKERTNSKIWLKKTALRNFMLCTQRKN